MASADSLVKLIAATFGWTHTPASLPEVLWLQTPLPVIEATLTTAARSGPACSQANRESYITNKMPAY